MQYYIFSTNDSPILNIESIGYSKDPSVTKFGPAQREQYIIHYVISGKGYFNGNEVSGGQGFIITPNSLEHYFPDRNNPWEFLWIISSDKRFHELLPHYFADDKTKIFTFSAENALKNVVELLKIKNKTVLNSYELLELFLSIFNSHIKNNIKNEEKSSADIYLDFAVNYINNNISSSVSVNDLTEILGISQTYLFKLFKNRFGVSTKHYISNCQIKKAKRLLEETELSVTQISASVGFSDVLSFSKFFSKNTGVSPSNFRQNLRKQHI